MQATCVWWLLGVLGVTAAAQPVWPISIAADVSSAAMRNLSVVLKEVEERYFAGSRLVTLAVVDRPGWWLRSGRDPIRAPRILVDTSVPLRLEEIRTDLNLMVLGPRVEDLRTILDVFPRTPRSPVLVLVYNVDDETTAMQECVDALWAHESVNAVVLVGNSSSYVLAYSYVPFRTGDCLTAGTPLLLDSWSPGHGWSQGATVFPRNTLLNLSNCSMRCVTTSVPYSVIFEGGQLHGVAVNTLDVVSRHMNFTYVTQNISDGKGWGVVLPNGTAIGLHGDVMHGRADIGMGEFLPFVQRYMTVDMVRPFKGSCLTWAVPSGLGQRHSLWKIVLQELPLFVWMALGAVVVITIGLVWSMSHAPWLFGIPSRYHRISFVIFFTVTSLLGQPSAAPPKGLTPRMTFGMWFFFSLIMCTAYVASLRSLLAKPWVRDDIHTLQGILDADLGIAVKTNYVKILKDIAEENVTVGALVRAAQPVWQGTDAVEAAAINRSLAVFNVRSVLEYFETWFRNENLGSPKLHVFKGYCAVNYFGVPFMFRKGSVITQPVDMYLQRLIEAGVISHWIANYTNPLGLPLGQPRSLGSGKHAALGKRHLAGVFLLLGAGSAVSLAVFLGEIANRQRLFQLGEKKEHLALFAWSPPAKTHFAPPSRASAVSQVAAALRYIRGKIPESKHQVQVFQTQSRDTCF